MKQYLVYDHHTSNVFTGDLVSVIAQVATFDSGTVYVRGYKPTTIPTYNDQWTPLEIERDRAAHLARRIRAGDFPALSIWETMS